MSKTKTEAINKPNAIITGGSQQAKYAGYSPLKYSYYNVNRFYLNAAKNVNSLEK